MICSACGGEIKGGFCSRCGKELLLGARPERYSKDAGVDWIPSDRRPGARDDTGVAERRPADPAQADRERAVKRRELPTLVTASAVTVAALTVGGVAALAYVVRASWIDATGVLGFFLAVSGVAHWRLSRRERPRNLADDVHDDPAPLEAWLESPDDEGAERWRRDVSPSTTVAWKRFRAELERRRLI